MGIMEGRSCLAAGCMRWQLPCYPIACRKCTTDAAAALRLQPQALPEVLQSLAPHVTEKHLVSWLGCGAAASACDAPICVAGDAHECMCAPFMRAHTCRPLLQCVLTQRPPERSSSLPACALARPRSSASQRA